MTMKTYLEEFYEAIEFANSLNLKTPDNIFFNEKKKYFTEEGNKKLITMFSKLFQPKLNTQEDMYQFASGMILNCSPFHYYLQQYVDQEFGCKSYFTIGYVLLEDSGKTFHKITKEDVRLSIKNIAPPKDHHAWLTLDSGEILDLTFPISWLSYNDISFYTKLKNGEIELSFISKHVNDFERTMSYKPILVGSDFFTKIERDLASLLNMYK